MLKILRIAVVAAGIVAGSLVAAAPANAISNCSSWFNGSRVGATCTSSAGATDKVRAVAYCRNAVTGRKWVAYGPHVYVHQTSWANCGAQAYAYDKSLQVS